MRRFDFILQIILLDRPKEKKNESTKYFKIWSKEMNDHKSCDLNSNSLLSTLLFSFTLYISLFFRERRKSEKKIDREKRRLMLGLLRFKKIREKEFRRVFFSQKKRSIFRSI